MIRFANWMTNGQGAADTETGVYTLSDPVPVFDTYSWTVTIPDATQRATWAAGTSVKWLLPSENEWYKAASNQVTVAYTLYGNATVNGAVDISDLSALGQNWNGAGKVWAQGDFNYDGNVDISDLSALGQHWNQSIAGFSGGEGGAIVPEPSTLVMLAAGLIGLLAYAWRKRK
jgi:hypothetical protein